MSELNLSQKTFLVVDDETFSLTIVLNMMRSLNVAQAFAAKNGAEAIQLLAGDAHHVDCVIADFNMPKVNGLELLKAIRTGIKGIRRDIPFAMLTGHSDKELVGLAIGLDVNAFLVKPVSKKALVARLERLLTEKRQLKTKQAYAAIDISSPLSEAPNMSDTPPPPKKKPEPTMTPIEMPPKEALEGDIPASAPPGVDEVCCMLTEVEDNDVLSRDFYVGGRLMFPANTVMTRSEILGLMDLTDLIGPIEEIWIRR